MSEEVSPGPSQQHPSTPAWLVPAAFAIGVLFMAVILGLVVYIPQPSVPQFEVFKVLLALGGAAFAMGIIGFLVVRLPIPGGGAITAGGALAVFVILYFFSPASRLVEPPKPKISFLKNEHIFVATDRDETLPKLLKRVAHITLGDEDKLHHQDVEKFTSLFDIQRPREVDDLIHSVANDTLATNDTRTHLRDWLEDENEIKIQTLRILAAFSGRPLAGSREYYALQRSVHTELQTKPMVVLGGEQALQAFAADINSEIPAGQSANDLIVTAALRFITVATTRLYSGILDLPQKYLTDADQSFLEYLKGIPNDHEKLVKLVAYSGDANSHFVEFECGGANSYSRFYVPKNAVYSAEAMRRMEQGPWPIGSPQDYFSESWWLDNAIWQMLSREHGRFLDELPLRIANYDAIGPP